MAAAAPQEGGDHGLEAVLEVGEELDALLQAAGSEDEAISLLTGKFPTEAVAFLAAERITVGVQNQANLVVEPGLFLAGRDWACNAEWLKAQRIRHIFNIPGHELRYGDAVDSLHRELGITVHRGSVDDTHKWVRENDAPAELRQLAEAVMATLPAAAEPPTAAEAAREAARARAESPAAGGVLVHCAAGQSRSAAVVAAVLMLGDGLTALEALLRLRGRRPCVYPNAALLWALLELERGQWTGGAADWQPSLSPQLVAALHRDACPKSVWRRYPGAEARNIAEVAGCTLEAAAQALTRCGGVDAAVLSLLS